MKSKQIQIEKKFGVPIREILSTLYTKNFYSYQSIADFLKVNSKSVRDWAKKTGIKSRSSFEAELCRRKNRSSPELLLRRLALHLSLCICPRCGIQKSCSRGEEWHEKGYCVMTCVDLKIKQEVLDLPKRETDEIRRSTTLGAVV